MNKKLKIIAIVLISISFILLLIVLITLISNKNRNKIEIGKVNLGSTIVDPNLVEINTEQLKKEHCLDGVCVSDLRLKSSKYYGVIYYKVKVKKTYKDKYAAINFGEFKAYINLGEIEKGKEVKRQYRYRNYDLREYKDYTLSFVEDDIFE